MIKKLICVLMVLIVGVGTLGIAAAQELRENIRFTSTEADHLWAEAAAGKTIADITENARKEGLEHPFTEEDLAAAGARIDRENGVIYMIRSAKELGKARTAEEAARMAWRLAGLLGGDEKMELELYARLNIGKTGIYCFSQTQDGTAMYGRMMKIMADEDGSVHTVISSLGFPEETDESLGMEEDLLSQKLVEAETPDVPDFKKLIPSEWKSEVETGTGEKISVTVPVARDPETGLWYLADPERKIMLGDFKKLVLEGQKDCLLTSRENAGWDEADVMVYYRIIQCWDYYAAKGWIGPDGQGTPVLVLNNLCLMNGESMENACYLGILQDRWQAFAYSQDVGFGKCLDVLAHEYTHCITETSAAGGMYKDDYGAINEAISDILGNICEMKLQATSDQEWNIGENLGIAFRSMSNPHEYNQPEYVWDQFYASKALYPNDINDRGGVHTNSSILNYTASQLCLNDGMTLEEALDFWMAVDLGLSSRTDYYQMASLMEWALETVGLEKYQAPLKALTEKTRMTLTERPKTVGEGLMRVELSLPDTEALKDHGWVLMGVQMHTWEAVEFILDLLTGSSDEEAEQEGGLATLLEVLFSEGTAEVGWESPEMLEMQSRLDKIFTAYPAWRAAEDEPLTMIMEQGLTTFYFLMNMDQNTLDLRSIVLLLGDEWVNLPSVSADESETDDKQAEKTLDNLFSMVVNFLFPQRTENLVLPVTGLESVTLPSEA